MRESPQMQGVTHGGETQDFERVYFHGMCEIVDTVRTYGGLRPFPHQGLSALPSGARPGHNVMQPNGSFMLNIDSLCQTHFSGCLVCLHAGTLHATQLWIRNVSPGQTGLDPAMTTYLM